MPPALGRSERWLSEFLSEAACKHEDECGLEQRLDDEGATAVAHGEVPALQQPGVGALDGTAPLPQAGSGRPPALVNAGPDAKPAAEFVMPVGIVPFVGEDSPDAC
jgi:hypothetical protein